MEQRIDLLEQFDEREGFQPVYEIAHELNIPLSTLNRLRRARDEGDPTSNYDPPEIGKDLEVLVDSRSSTEAKLTALINLISWKLFPNNRSHHRAGVAACITSYLSLKRKVTFAGELGKSDRDMLLGCLNLHVLRRVCSNDAYLLPISNIYPLDINTSSGVDELDVIADVVWCLLAYENRTNDRRKAASVTRAYGVLQEEEFGYAWEVSKKTFMRLWQRHVSAAAFHFVERKPRVIGLTLNPQNDDFANKVDSLLADPLTLRRFLANCRWVQERLQETLHPAALAFARFPSFPSDIQSVAVDITPLTWRQTEIMSKGRDAW